MTIWEGFAGRSFDNRYEFMELLGQGSWSEVVRAFDRIRGLEVAVKLLKDRPGEEVLADRFFRSEFRAMAKIDHPNVVRVLDFGQCPEGVRYYTMEVVPGQRLTECLGRLRGKPFLGLFRGLCRALLAVHSKRCLHCDVKPANIMLIPQENRPVLMDFSLNLDLSSRADAVSRGTPVYAAPEMFAGRPFDARADIYSLGVTLLEVLAGENPFRGLSLSSFLSAKASDDAIRRSLASIPKRYRDCIAKMTASDPRDRFPSCLTVLNTISEKRGRARDVPSPPLVPRRLLYPDLIGREGELEAITSRIDDLSRKKGCCVLIQGPRRSGKTRLLDEAKYYAQLSGAMVVTEADQPALERRASLAPALRRAVGLEGPDQVSPDALLHSAQRQSEQRPLMFLVDDIHRLGPSDARLWSSLAHRAAKGGYLVVSSVCLRGCTPGSEVGFFLEALSEEDGCLRLNVGSLNQEEVSGLCESMLGSSDDVGDVTRFLMRQTGGNVGACVETLNALAAEGRLTHHLGRWSVTDRDSTRARTKRQSTVLGLKCLPAERLTVLLAAAVNGPRAPAAVVRQTVDLPESVFAEHVLQLENTGLLTWETIHNHAFVRFVSPPLATQLLEKADVAELSGRAANVLLSRRAKGLPFDPALLVEQLLRAGRSDQASEVAIMESKRCESEGDLSLGIHLPTLALKLSESSEGKDSLQEAELHMAIARMLRRSGEAAGAVNRCEQAFSSLGKLEPGGSNASSQLRVQLHKEAGLGCEDLGDHNSATDHYQESLLLLNRLPDSTLHEAERVGLQNLLGWTQMLAQHYEEAEKTANDLLDHLDPDLYPNEAAGGLATLGWIRTHQGEVEGGLGCFSQPLSGRWRVALSPDAELQCLTGAAGASWLLGRWNEAISYFQRAASLAERHLNPAVRSNTIQNLAVAEYQLGKLILAEAHFREYLDSMIELGDIEGYVIGLNNLGALLRDQNRNEEAFSLLQKARRIASKGHCDGLLLMIEGNMGELLLNKGKRRRAESLLRGVLQRALRDEAAHLLSEGYRRMASVALALGSSGRFNYHARRCEQQAQRVGDQLELCYIQRLKARHYASRKEWKKAEELFSKVVSSFGSRGASFEGALTKLQWAELCLKDGSSAKAEQLLVGLEAVFESAGAAKFATRVRDLQANLPTRMPPSDDIAQILEALKGMKLSDGVELGCQSVARTVVLMTGADRGLIIGLNRQGMIQFEASDGFTGLPQHHLAVPAKILKYVAQSQEPLLIESAMTDARFLDSSSILSLHIGSVICCPVFVEDDLHAVLYADSKEPGHFCEHKHLPLMQLLARQIGLFLDNLRFRGESELVEELTACLAHEMRSLLNGVICTLRLMTLPSQQPLSDHVHSASEQITRLLRLADETIDLMRAKNRSQLLRSETIDMNALIRHVAKVLQLIVQERGLSLKLELSDALVPIKGQPEALDQVMTNLIVNACKYTNPGGTIRIESRPASGARDQSVSGPSYLYLSHTDHWQGTFASVSVIDDGEGMDAAECERLFQKYVTLRKVEDVRYAEGSGLGLYICRKIIEQHGGRIWAVSQKDKGTRVTFTLPVASSQDGQ